MLNYEEVKERKRGRTKMGDTIIREVEQDKRETGTSRGTGGTGSAKGTSPTDTKTTAGRTGGGTGGGTGGTTANKEKVISTMVDVEEQKRLERNAKRRERYAKQKAEGTLKPKKVNNKKSKEVIETNQIETLIKTISVMVSSRQGQEHWLLLDSEVKAIAEPLTNILKDSDAFSSISEHSNAVALVVACITIILPRTIKSVTDINAKKKKKREVLKNVELRGSKTKNITNDKGNNRNTSANDKNDGSNAIWYGDAISL